MSKDSRKIQFENYLNKWGFNKFRFFARYPLHIFDTDYIAAHPNYIAMHGNNEIVCVDTLVKWAKQSTKIYLYCDNNRVEFNNFDELKHYTLIRKLSKI